MHREVGKARKVAETRAAARLVTHMLTRGEQPSGLLRDMGCARRVVRVAPCVQTRVLLNAETAAGVTADGRGRWAVDCILGWRGPSSKREALVQWRGFDRRSGEAHRNTWEPRSHLTSDLRAGGLILPKRTYTAFQPPPRPAGARKLSRLAGGEPAGLLDEVAVRRAARLKRERDEAEDAFEKSSREQRRSRRLGGLPAPQKAGS